MTGRLLHFRRHDGRVSHQLISPDIVRVLSVRDRARNVRVGDDADRLAGLRLVTMRAVAFARFIRYAAAATWSLCSTVVTGGCTTPVTVAWGGAGWASAAGCAGTSLQSRRRRRGR